MPRVLLLLPTSTYRTEAFLGAAQSLGCEIVVASDRPNAVVGRRSAGYLALDFADPEDAAREAEAFHEEMPLGAVIAVDEVTAVVAAAVGTLLGLPHNPLEAARTVARKDLLREALEAAGVAAPAWRRIEPGEDPAVAAAEVRFPCVAKPVALSGSRGVLRADDPDELEESVARIRRLLASPSVREPAGQGGEVVLVEAYVPGPEVALEGLLRRGSLHPLALFDKPDQASGPTFEETILVTPSRLPPEVLDRIVETVQRAVTAVGLLEGALHAELRIGPDGPVVLELAARSIGGRCSKALTFGTGSTLEELLLRAALGESPPLEPSGPASGVLMLPVERAGRLREIRGIDAALAVEGIVEIDITAHEGMELVPLPEGDRYLGFVFARADTPERVEAALRAAWRRLEVVARS